MCFAIMDHLQAHAAPADAPRPDEGE
jgi:hypothetical protein